MLRQPNCQLLDNLEVKPQVTKIIVTALAAMTKLPHDVPIPPVLLRGTPGVGKSQFMMQLARSLDLPFVAVSAVMLMADWLAIPTRGERIHIHNTDAIIIEYAYPKFLFEFLTAGSGILIIDELDKLPRELMSAVLGILSERRVGYVTFPSRVLLIGAINPLGSGGYQLIDQALANRFIHLTFDIDTSEIIHHLRNITSPSALAFYNLSATISADLFQHNFLQLSRLIAKFLESNQQNIFESPAENWSEEYYAYTTPRSLISLALPALAALISARFVINNIEFVVPLSSQVTLTLLESTLGYKNATLLFRFLTNPPSELDINTILSNPESFPYSDFDKRIAVIDKIAQYFNANTTPHVLQQITKLLQYILVTYHDASLASLLVTKIKKAVRKLAKTYAQSHEFQEFVSLIAQWQEVFYGSSEEQ